MATGPGDELEAAGRGHLRASHADREQVVGALKAAFVQGRLDKDEFDLRIGQALTSRTYGELAALTADLPARLTRARPPEPARQPVNKKAVATLTGATPALVGMVAAVMRVMKSATPWPVALSVIVIMVVLLVAVPTGWLWLFHTWLDQRAGRQSGQGLPPGRGGEANQRTASADPGRQLPPVDPGPQHTEAAQSRRPRPRLPDSQSLRRWRTPELLAGQRPAVTGAP
jgi:hypothetical protein